jgi:pyridinium-3,5-bisthiocarboxylic acid mononucleotide nickel chelatase
MIDEQTMNSLYFDASSGLSGDMMLGALLDLGADPERFREQMSGLGLPVEISIKEVRRGGFRALKVDVDIQGSPSAERRWADVESVIRTARFSDAVKTRALSVFRRLFEAEARVHGCAFAEVHLHEAGADDALVDIVGSCLLLETLDIDDILCSRLNVGGGYVKTAHGLLPVPPPAVAEILTHVPVHQAGAETELVTPTGAALIAVLARGFVSFPEFSYVKVGCGAGTKELPHLPNILRAFLVRRPSLKDNALKVIQTVIDDANPQLLARFIDIALDAGALDAYLTPVVMKKNRLATQLTVLSPPENTDRLIEKIFRETPSLGVRIHSASRRVLDRKNQTVRVFGQEIGVKTAFLAGEEVNAQPEYEDCLKAAAATGRPLKDIQRRAAAEYAAAASKPGGDGDKT